MNVLYEVAQGYYMYIWKVSGGTAGFPLRINHLEIACHFVLHGSKCCVYLEVMPAYRDYVEKFISSCYCNIFYLFNFLCGKN